MTFRDPAPEAPDVTDAHVTPLEAFQLQSSAEAVTWNVTCPPAAGTEALAGVREYVQAMPACVTEAWIPAIVSAVVREADKLLVCTLNETDSDPLKGLAEAGLTHATGLDTVQEQSGAEAVTPKDTVVAAAETFADSGVTE